MSALGGQRGTSSFKTVNKFQDEKTKFLAVIQNSFYRFILKGNTNKACPIPDLSQVNYKVTLSAKSFAASVVL